jgi:hypothetical protein
MELKRLYNELRLITKTFSSVEWELLDRYSEFSEAGAPCEIPPKVRSYSVIKDQIRKTENTIYPALRAKEAAKIRRALAELDNWLLHS